MLHHLGAVVFVILAWWLSTGTILFAAGRQNPNTVPVMMVATILAITGIAGIWLSAAMDDVSGTYLGFLSALAVWAWHEASFLTGTIIGPRREACPAGLEGFARFKAAFMAVRDHEIAIALTGVLIIALSLGGGNLTGMWTFLLLWAMRITAKLVLFFGAPHVAVGMLPQRLAYLASYFRTDRTSAVLPAFIIAMVFVFAVLCHSAATASQNHDAISMTILATFLALAIIEHLFLVLPVSDSALWRWAMPREARAGEVAGDITEPKSHAGSGFADSRSVSIMPAVKAAGSRR